MLLQMAGSCNLSPRRRKSPEAKKKRSSTSLNLREKVHRKSELKSSIPKPSKHSRPTSITQLLFM